MDPTKFNKPPSPEQLAQEQRRTAAQARMQQIKGRGKPLGGAPPVHIPPLDAKPMMDADGNPMTMHSQAEALRDPTSPLSPLYDPKLALAVGSQRQMDPYALRGDRNAQPATQPGPFGGILPPEAVRDPRFVQGVGSMYAANQPALRNRGSQQERKMTLSEETLAGLDAIRRFQEDATKAQDGVVKKEEEKDKASIQETSPTPPFKDQPDLSGLLEQIRSEQERMGEDRIDKLRKEIEARCEPLSVERLIEEGEARQEVPIVRDKLVVTYRTLSGEEDLAIKRELYGVQGGDNYLIDLLGMMQMTAGIYAINRRPLPFHLDDRRRWNKDLFYAKLDIVKAYPIQMLAIIGLNFTWFDQRTRELFIDLEPLKNG